MGWRHTVACELDRIRCRDQCFSDYLSAQMEPDQLNANKIYYCHFLDAFTKIHLAEALTSCKSFSLHRIKRG
jgi:hypothetical protein